MISPICSFSFFLLSAKDSFNFSYDYSLEYPVLFLIMLFPSIQFLLKFCFLNFSSVKDSNLFVALITSFFLLLFFSFCSYNPFHFLFFLELCVIYNILFLFNYSKDLDKVSSIIFMILFNMVGSIPFFWFCSFFTDLSVLSISNSYLIMLCFSLLLCSKLPIFFFHFWLTKAHVSASGAGSMILASLMLKIGTVGFLKWSNLFSVLFNKKGYFLFISSLSFSLLMLLVMIRFFDLKYLVACSSVVHMGILFPLFLWNSSISFFSSSLMMVSHSLVSCVIFFLMTYLYELSYERSVSSSKSLESFSYILSLSIFLWFLLNLGLPPFISFMSEIYFLLFFLSLDLLSMTLFFFILLVSGLIFFSLVSFFLYSKKCQFKQENLSLFFSFSNSIFFFFFFLMCFFF